MKELGDNATPWRAFIELTRDIQEPFVTTLKADMEILRDIARGFSSRAIANKYGIESSSVYDVAYTWGFVLLDNTLDMDCLSIYSTSLAEFINDYLTISPIEINRHVLEQAYENCTRYLELKDILDEYE